MNINNITLQMLDMLPSWMKMRADPENSEGAKFLDAFGKQIDDYEKLIENILTAHHLELNNLNIEGVNIGSVDVVYKFIITNEVIDTDNEVFGYTNNIATSLVQARTVYDFYKVTTGVDKFYYDPNLQIIYVKDKYDRITVNGAEFTESLEHNVWGPYDEIGLMIGCPRLSGERNPEYRIRLMDVFQRPGNSTRQGLVNYLSRSFAIAEDNVQIEELSDDFVASLINSDGTLKSELKEYIKLSNRINLANSNVYWDILEENHKGISYLPMVWNTSLEKWNEYSIVNGIGHDTDLEVIGPEQETPTQEFTCHVGVEGLKTNKNIVYPQHEFKYRLVATGKKHDSGYQPENYKYSVIASELVPLKFKVKAHKQYTHTIDLSFSGTISDYSIYNALTENEKAANYITKNVSIVPGSQVMNPNNKYLEVFAGLATDDKTQTPKVNSLTINYHEGATAKQIVITGDSTLEQTSADLITVGFKTNSWTDTSPILRVRSDTNDMVNAIVNGTGGLELAHGEYQRIYSSEGDWDDGEQINTHTTVNGTLKLSI